MTCRISGDLGEALRLHAEALRHSQSKLIVRLSKNNVDASQVERNVTVTDYGVSQPTCKQTLQSNHPASRQLLHLLFLLFI
jgi:hypothetical protein